MKKKILLLSDDIRMHSGVATVSKDIVMGTLHKYDWVQIGAAVKHPEEGQIIDMCQAAKSESGVSDAYLKIYPMSGYGNPHVLREIMSIEKPDAILHYTDPRFWIWLYNMEHEIRQDIPIMYYNIWDDLPTPMYNEQYYRSSDSLMAISKQTYGINKRVLKDYEDWQISYIPHGINSKKFFKLKDKGDTKFNNFKRLLGIDKYKYNVLYLNRNIRRKSPGDVLMAFKSFVSRLDENQQKECALIFHTAVSDENGTDIRAVHQAVCPEYNVIFTHDFVKGGSLDDEHMNYLYNASDVYINLASNEGFGLGSCEALTTGTPVIVNVTGGLQDQCGFKNDDDEYLTHEDYVELGSNHRGKYKQHGEWVVPVFPSNISLQGSPLTPYIFDDRVQYEDAADALMSWYLRGPDERERCGDLGIKFVKDKKIGMDSEEMSNRFVESIEKTFSNWKPRKKYTLEAV